MSTWAAQLLQRLIPGISVGASTLACVMLQKSAPTQVLQACPMLRQATHPCVSCCGGWASKTHHFIIRPLAMVKFHACRHRLIVPKYNPARTYTPEGTVSFGGSFMAIYPMESPGGYQLVGRSLPIWNTFGRVGPFAPAKPWLFETFDQVSNQCASHHQSHLSAALLSVTNAHIVCQSKVLGKEH